MKVRSCQSGTRKSQKEELALVLGKRIEELEQIFKTKPTCNFFELVQTCVDLACLDLSKVGALDPDHQSERAQRNASSHS